MDHSMGLGAGRSFICMIAEAGGDGGWQFRVSVTVALYFFVLSIFVRGVSGGWLRLGGG